MKIILIGFMGSGKSVVGKALRDHLGWPLLEMDELVCQKAHTATMHEVFARGGEALLRSIEADIALEHRNAENVIISTGAGVVMTKCAIEHLQFRCSTTIFLHASFPLVARRLRGDTSRPLFTDAIQAKLLYDLRLPLYFAYADKVVAMEGKSACEVAQEIISMSLMQRTICHGK